MKLRLVLLLVVMIVVASVAFRKGETADARPEIAAALTALRPQSVQSSAFGVSPKVSSLEIPVIEKSGNPTLAEVGFGGNFKKPPTAVMHDEDAALATPLAVAMPTPSLTFEGLNNRMNADIFGIFYLPSDSNGDVGPNHYVQAVNTLLRVYDKSGLPLTPPFRMSDLFTPLGTACSTRNDGQPSVVYDPLADRWLLSQYCQAFPPFRQMIAVSKTGDPTGEYFIYEFVMPNNRINDYTKFGVWPDAFYMSDDEFIGSDFAGSGMFAFDRAKMLRGDPAASYIYFNIPSTSVVRLRGLLPADLDGLTAPPANSPGIFASFTANEYGDAQDALRLFNFHADFENPLSSTFTERAESPLAVAAFDPTSPEGRADIAQPAPGDFLDSQSDRLMHRVAYRNLGTHESIVFNQTVRTSPVGSTYRAGVRFYELRRNGGAFSVFDASTLGDNAGSRWMGAAATDRDGNAAFGYSFVNDEKKPSILYSGRLATEAPGTFRSEATLFGGTGVQTAFGFRWGNVSGMNVDPVDDCTFWMTNQYFSAESQAESPFSWLTRIGRFKYDECTPAPRSGLKVAVSRAITGEALPNAEVEVFPAQNTSNAPYFRRTLADGSTERMILPPGSVTVRASLRGYRTASINTTLVNNPDGTTFVGIPLAPVAIPESVATAVTNESCSPNKTVDPGETVTFALTLRNSGIKPTANLTATLLATGGVIAPSGSQNYGAITPGPQTVTRSFTFTASPQLACGAPIVLTFALSDGAETLEPLTITIGSGAPRTAFFENFDNVSAPNLPFGWTTSATGAALNWTTSVDQRQTFPNSVFSPSPNQIALNELVSPVFQVVSTNASVEFRNWYELETTFLRNRLYDGSVFEIKIGNGAWQDIEAAGGSFLSGGYDGVIDSCCQNPLGGRRGWSGRSGINQTSEFITSKATLPSSAAGQSVQLRWRVGNDIGTFRQGQYIDNLVVNDGAVCGCRASQAFRAPFDFDADGKTDRGVFNPSNDPQVNDFRVAASGGASINRPWGSIGDVAVPSDYDGDGKTDFAVFRPSGATWFVLRSSDNTAAIVNFGLATDRVVPADFDGDGKSDIAVYRPNGGIWFVLASSNGAVRIRNFGITEDLPAVADYDGDARADLAVFRPSTGVWYALQSSDDNARAVRFGLAGDKPVAGDYDGDGRGDFVVYRPTEGVWYLLGTTNGFSAVGFGLASDLPLQADFDGDGRRDIAVFRPSDGVWYHLQSSDGAFRSSLFGGVGDVPLASVFVP